MAGMQVVVVATATTTATSTSPTCSAKVDAARATTWPRSWSPTRRRTACSRTTITRASATIVHDARRPGLRRRRQPQRAGRAGPPGRVRRRRLATSTCTRPSASRTAAAAPASARSRARRTWRRSCPATRCTPAERRRRHRRRSRAAPLRLAPASCRSRGCTSRLMGADGPDAGPPRSRSSTPTTSPPACDDALPGALHRRTTASSPTSASSTCARSPRHDRRHRRGRRQAPDRLRLPRPDACRFPVAGTLMVEPTESEDLGRARPLLRRDDRDPRARSTRSAPATWTVEDNPLRNAPHTAAAVVGAEWDRAYTREQAVFPVHAPRAGQVLAAGRPHRRRLRRPQPGLLLPAAFRDSRTKDS